ncbi:hypothetical protein AB205_0202420, partial [Aquarana catesbeiana]
CGKCFTQKGNLLAHQKTHIRERPYSCLECGKSFTKKRTLLTHQKIHMRERFTRESVPIHVHSAGNLLIKKNHLVLHQKIHTGERPYLCSEFGKCFGQKRSLL